MQRQIIRVKSSNDPDVSVVGMPICGHAEKARLKLSDYQRRLMSLFDTKIRRQSIDPGDNMFARGRPW
jgi:hypothetical protein